MADLIGMPKQKDIKAHAKTAIQAGVGGVMVGVGSQFGILGTIISGILAGAVTGNDAVTVNAVMDGVQGLFLAGGSSNGGATV